MTAQAPRKRAREPKTPRVSPLNRATAQIEALTAEVQRWQDLGLAIATALRDSPGVLDRPSLHSLAVEIVRDPTPENVARLLPILASGGWVVMVPPDDETPASAVVTLSAMQERLRVAVAAQQTAERFAEKARHLAQEASEAESRAKIELDALRDKLAETTAAQADAEHFAAAWRTVVAARSDARLPDGRYSRDPKVWARRADDLLLTSRDELIRAFEGYARETDDAAIGYAANQVLRAI